MSDPDFGRALRHALDPALFAQDVLGFVCDPWQKRVLQSKSRRVLLNISRQAGKTTTTSILALHEALFNPKSLILVFSKAQRQATELLSKIREFISVMETPPDLPKDAATEIKLENGSRILSLPGDGSTTRGFSSPRLIILDEAAFVVDELYDSFYPMLANGKSRLFMLSTPNGRQGAFFNAWISDAPNWHRETVTANEIPRISKVFLDEALAELGPQKFSQEFLCQFIDAEGQYFSEAVIDRAFSRDIPAMGISF